MKRRRWDRPILLALLFLSAWCFYIAYQPKPDFGPYRLRGQVQLPPQGFPRPEEKIYRAPVPPFAEYPVAAVPPRPEPVYIGPDDELIIGWNVIGRPEQFPEVDGRPAGFQPEVVEAVMNEMGQCRIWVREDDPARLAKMLDSGRVHLVAARVSGPPTGFSRRRAEIQDALRFHLWVREDEKSIGGTTVDQVMDSLDGRLVGAPPGAGAHERFNGRPGVRLVLFGRLADLWSALESGEVDAVYCLDRLVWAEIGRSGLAVRPAGPALASVPYGAWFYGGVNPGLVERYNQALSLVKSKGIYQDRKRAWFGAVAGGE